MINRFSHWLSHLFKVNDGRVVTWLENGDICVGFKCSGCGKIAESSVVKISESEILK